jgi:hypothetical protein
VHFYKIYGTIAREVARKRPVTSNKNIMMGLIKCLEYEVAVTKNREWGWKAARHYQLDVLVIRSAEAWEAKQK